MNNISISHAVEEAKRFIARAEDLWAETDAQQASGQSYINAPKQSGALRRASLDLTRALSEMRKP